MKVLAMSWTAVSLPKAVETQLDLICTELARSVKAHAPPFSDLDKQAAADRLFQHVWHLSASGGFAAALPA